MCGGQRAACGRLLPYGSWEWHSGHQAWQQMALPAGPNCYFKKTFLLCRFYFPIQTVSPFCQREHLMLSTLQIDLLEILVWTVLLCWVTILMTPLWWEVGSLWIPSVLTAFCCLESLSALSPVKVYTQVCFGTSCHILISSFLQQAYVPSKFAEPDWLHTRFCFSAAMLEFHSTAWGKPWNLLCSSETASGYNCSGIQRPGRHIRQEALPPLAQVNGASELPAVRVHI